MEKKYCYEVMWEVEDVKRFVGQIFPILYQCTFHLFQFHFTEWHLKMSLDYEGVKVHFTRCLDRGLKAVEVYYDIRLMTTDGKPWKRTTCGRDNFFHNFSVSTNLVFLSELRYPDNGLFFEDGLKVSIRLWPSHCRLDSCPNILYLRSEEGIWDGDKFPASSSFQKTIETNTSTSTPIDTKKSSTTFPYRHLQSLARDFSRLFDDRTLSDFTICCGGQSFTVHKAVLGARSPVFKTMLTSQMVESSANSVEVPDFTPDTVWRLVAFLYSGSVPDLDDSAAPDLYAAADKYGVLELRDLCSGVMVSGLSLQSLPLVLSLADRHSDKHLKKKALSFACKNKMKLLHSPEWAAFMEEDPVLALQVSHDLHTREQP